jgi:transcriptional regulator GlxA family with amidase domain
MDHRQPIDSMSIGRATRPHKRRPPAIKFSQISYNIEVRNVVIVGPPPVQMLDVAGPMEVFSNTPGYDVKIGNPGLDDCLPTSRGLSLTGAIPLKEIRKPIDTLLIAGGPGAETGVYDEEFVSWIAEAGSRSRRVASICTGVFLIAAAGLFDGKEAVTHWRFCDQLAKEFPKVKVRPEPIVSRDGSVYTSAGITAGIDLSLALVEEDHGHRVALDVARFLVMFLVRPGGQAQFSHMLSRQAVTSQPSANYRCGCWRICERTFRSIVWPRRLA